jgi:TDG/mug DNA glycosylase family protein
VGLSDLAKSVAGNDSVLTPADFDPGRLRRKILRFRPRVLAFTSKRAGSEFLGRSVNYGLQNEQIAETRIFILNSTSGLATAHWNGGRQWYELARFLQTVGQA